jgi:hypothetical protein
MARALAMTMLSAAQPGSSDERTTDCRPKMNRTGGSIGHDAVNVTDKAWQGFVSAAHLYVAARDFCPSAPFARFAGF